MQVLDDEQNGAVLARATSSSASSASNTRDCATSPAAAPPPRPGRIASRAERSGGARAWREGSLVAHQGPERGEQRGVGKLVVAELDAVAREDACAGLVGVPRQLVGKPGLADA